MSRLPAGETMHDLFFSLIRLSGAKTIVEVGCHAGNTTYPMCLAAKETGGHVHAFDAWSGHVYKEGAIQTSWRKDSIWRGMRSKLDVMKSKVLASFKQRQVTNVTFYQLDTLRERDKFERMINGLPLINFAFIDGCHTYEGVKNDFEVIYPRLSTAGMIAFHDTLWVDGVREFVLDLRCSGGDGTYDLIDLPWGLRKKRVGIGLLVKRSYPYVGVGIAQPQGSPSSSEEILARERAWYDAQRTQ